MNKKAFEIACALIRIAGYSGNEHFKSYLEAYAMALVDSVESGSAHKSASALQAIRQFLLLGTFSGFLSEEDRALMDSQISELADFIAALPDESGNMVKELHLQDIFTESGKTDTNSAAVVSKPAKIDRVVRHPKSEPDNGALQQRQERIIEIIRQSGNCKVRELQDKLPDISERTIRYDIQALVEQGIVERFGPGGPSTYYRLKTPGEQIGENQIKLEAQPESQTQTKKTSSQADASAPLWLDA
jgi:DNA-binding HxlR family transcriptional regulator